MRLFVSAVLVLPLLFAALPAAADGPAPAARPLLVTVDDLPLAGAAGSDAAEREAVTRALLAALAKHRVRAVGFVIWDHVRTDADRQLLALWLAAGHELGNHTAGHPDLSRTDAETYVADVEAGRAGLAAFLAGERRGAPRFFRYPYLAEGETTAKLEAVRAALARTGQRNLPVTIDTQDWSFDGPWRRAVQAGDRAAQEAVAADYQAALRTGVRHYGALGDRLFGRTVPQVLLLHANAVGSAQWDALFAWLTANGHRFAPADEVLADPAFAVTTRFTGAFGCSQWDRIARDRDEDEARAGAERLLEAQAAAWNRGDLEGFAAAYAADAAFVAPSGVAKGRQALLERYRKRYPDARAMGRLAFEVQEVRFAGGREVSLLGDAVPGRVHGMSVVARWRLSYPDRPEASGMTLLVLAREGGRWVVVQDASM